MLNNINDHGVSKSNKVGVLNTPGATSGDIVILTMYWKEKQNHWLSMSVGTT